MASLFSGTDHARLYVRYRPEYPAEMYARIYSYLDNDKPQKSWKLAVDAGCGSGQNTRTLASRFDRVLGFDTSEAQIKEAIKANVEFANLNFHCSSASDLGGFIGDGSVDLVMVATALHWFDAEKFYKECSRVLRPGGVLAAFSYEYPTLYEPQAVQALKLFAKELEPYLSTELKHVFDHYASLFPVLQKIFKHSERDDSFKIQLKLSIEEFCGFVSTFSPYQTLRRENPDGPDPAAQLSERLQSVYQARPDEKGTALGCLDIFLLLARNV